MPEIIGKGIQAGVSKLGDIGVVAAEAATEAAVDAAKKTTEEIGKGMKKILGGD